MSGYGAIDNRPKTGVVAGAIVGVALLILAAASVIVYQSSEHKRRDASDYDSLDAEYDALRTAAEPLGKLSDLARPDAPPADFAAALADARAAYERYTSPPRRSNALPSGRPWPGQFVAADDRLKGALDHFGMVTYYLDLRSKTKPSKVSGTTNVDADINNVADMGREQLAALNATLDRMKQQRDGHAWEYGAVAK